jgi:mono/diheme cytochrome c family protein
VIKHGIAVLAGALLFATASAAAPGDVLSFGKGKPVPSGDVTTGQNIFNAVCFACHASDLGGGRAPPLTGAGFFKEWGGRSAGELSDFIQNRMPQDDPGALSARGARAVVAYIVAYANRPESLKDGGAGK